MQADPSRTTHIYSKKQMDVCACFPLVRSTWRELHRSHNTHRKTTAVYHGRQSTLDKGSKKANTAIGRLNAQEMLSERC
jgi:hypothetical protein